MSAFGYLVISFMEIFAFDPRDPELVQLEQIALQGLRGFAATGRALSEIKRRKLYLREFPSWEKYLSSRWGMSEEQSRRLRIAASIFDEDLPMVSGYVTNESQIRPLTALKTSAERRIAFGSAIEMAGNVPPNASHVSHSVQRLKLKTQIAGSSKSNGKSCDKFELENNHQAKIMCGDSCDASLLQPGLANLILGSPPYNLGIHYPTFSDDLPASDYSQNRKKWLENCLRWAADQGRLAINVPLDVSIPVKAPLGALFTNDALEVGWTYVGTILWREGSDRLWRVPTDPPANPQIMCSFEMILIFSKGTIGRSNPGIAPDITPAEYQKWIREEWRFPGEHASKIGHPSPFPRELPRRLIKMFPTREI